MASTLSIEKKKSILAKELTDHEYDKAILSLYLSNTKQVREYNQFIKEGLHLPVGERERHQKVEREIDKDIERRIKEGALGSYWREKGEREKERERERASERESARVESERETDRVGESKSKKKYISIKYNNLI
tara:strand:- start:689 stop:1090 length:402 start_codon:yes stop_codon:yes gene_type:complete